jgi:phosphoesterase RecJ-like protein
MAENIYSGLHSDTGGFRYDNTNARTLELAALMLSSNPEAPRAILEMGRMFPKGVLRYKALAFSAIEEIAGGKGAMIALSYGDLEKGGIKFSDTEAASLSSELMSVKDWLVGATLVEKEPGRVRVSLRSKGSSINVSTVAVSLGGGGHPRAAGILMTMSMEEAREKITQSLEGVLG